MYKCFNLSLDLNMFKSDLDYKTFKENFMIPFIEVLNKAIDENGIISADDFIDSWFHTDNYDVFLSYSHDDEKLALSFASFLKTEFNLNVFIDKLFWGSADKLIYELDNKFCKKSNGTYYYKKRNFTTTHVHAMLSTAIARTIYNSEIIIFINSEKSTYNLKNEIGKNRTLSPWIYEEIFFTSIISKREWYNHRNNLLNENKANIQFEKPMEMSYSLPDEHLIQLDCNDLKEWKKLWENSNKDCKKNTTNLNYSICHPLNVLYRYISDKN